MAGLASVRVLSDHFEQVTLVERDPLADSPLPRKGVPQAHHVHGLLKRGEQLFGGLFPDLIPALVAGGATPLEFGKDVHWNHFGEPLAAIPGGGIPALSFSRAFFEAEVRRRTLALANVKLLDGHEALSFATNPERTRVTGAVLRRVGGADQWTAPADLVVDTCGRGSQTPRWLQAIGRPPVAESILKVDLCYGSKLFKRPPDGVHPWKAIMVASRKRRMGIVVPVEGGRWLASLTGLLGDHPPTDEKAWLAFAREMESTELHDALVQATPLSEVMTHKFPFHQRRHYEKMKDFPDGLMVLGDSHCSFSPVYGQGMTTAVIGATLLGEEVARARQQGGAAEGTSRRFQRRLAESSNDPWAMSTGEDLRFPEVEGTRPFGNSVLLWYTARMLNVAAEDPEVALCFYRVMNLLDPLPTLMRPKMVLRVLRGRREERRQLPLAGLTESSRSPVAGAPTRTGTGS